MAARYRIISLISSATEIACALGLKSQLVGISHECDFPDSIRHLPVVSETKINPGAPAAEIHTSVLSMIEQGLSIYRIKADVLESLAPDIILTQDQCDVCAVSLNDVEAAVRKVTKKNTTICSLFPFSLDDICKDFRKIGAVAGCSEAAEALITQFWIRLNQVNARAGTHLQRRPKVLALEWLDPPIVAGSWIPELITLAGGDPLIVDGPQPFKKVTWAELQNTHPDIVIIFPCGWSSERTSQELRLTHIAENLKAWSKKTNALFYVGDGNQYFNRPGPRIADSLEILGAVLWPDKFPDHREKYQNKAFVQINPAFS